MLLPPSEGKSRPDQGTPVHLESLSFQELTDQREAILGALIATSGKSDARTILKVGASLVAEVSANTELRSAPAAPAHAIYSGVLYDALGYARLSQQAQERADREVVVVSALWGAVGFADRIPAYRLSMRVNLPGIGKLAPTWRPVLTKALSQRAGDDLVVDVRSSTYAAAAKTPVETSVAVDVVQERNGARKVVSHFAKHTRGELVGRLLASGEHPGTPREFLDLVQQWWPAELTPATRTKPAHLTVVLPENHKFTSLD